MSPGRVLLETVDGPTRVALVTGALRNKHPTGVHTLSLGFLELCLGSRWSPSIQGNGCIARPLRVCCDPVPTAVKHGNYLELAMPVGGGFIVKSWLDPQKTGI